MELLSSRFLITWAGTKLPAGCWMKPVRTRISRSNFQYFRLITGSKKSTDQDFQDYAKPSSLLPTTEVKVCPDSSVEKAINPFSTGRLKSLYKVKLQTSKIYGSGLTDVNSGILLCLIDENGSSILQRLPAIASEFDSRLEGKSMYDSMHFQRGSVDEFIFEGPNLGRIAAVWIGLESGLWRVAGVNLTVIQESPSSSAKEDQETKQLTALQYSFESEDVLIGDSGDFSMMELRPHSVTTLSGDVTTLFNKRSLNSSPTLTSNEESMKEYTDLKFSLLFYDTVLIMVGCSIAFFSTGETAAYAFLTGGLCGFFYLLLLQRSVDGLEANEVIPSENQGGFNQIIGKLRGPVLSLVLTFAFIIIVVKYSSGKEAEAVKLTAKELIFGTTGFLMCKVSVVLAAFKPLRLGSREKQQKV